MKNKQPHWIEDAECRLVLHKNCRNTAEIFKTACSIIGRDSLTLNEIHGDTPFLRFYSTEKELNSIIEAFLEKMKREDVPAEKITILSASTIKNSFVSLSQKYAGFELSETKESGKVHFTTIRKFKGLESDAILIVDASMIGLKSDEDKRLLYVGASRAKNYLEIAMNQDVSDSDIGESETGKDVIYVGKSKNGLKNRPTSHENLYDHWDYCYVLTQFEERTFFNDGTIQYIEDQVNKRVNDINHYENKTSVTTGGTANRNDEEDCDEYLQKAYLMLDVLGLDLITFMQDDSEAGDDSSDSQADGTVPDGNYHMSRRLKSWGNKIVKGQMQVANGKYILLKGSDVCPNEGKGLFDAVRIKREAANVFDDVLQEDVVFSSPTGPAVFALGCSANGWTTWKTDNGEAIDKYRDH